MRYGLLTTGTTKVITVRKVTPYMLAKNIKDRETTFLKTVNWTKICSENPILNRTDT